ncbi:hypothetical protein TNCV_104401 [Trichonephila clavipes]|nr:hypothetical protein TNCV_104401 [Trichonephila clavipes]
MMSTIYTRILTDEIAQRGEPMVRDSLTKLKNPRSYARFKIRIDPKLVLRSSRLHLVDLHHRTERIWQAISQMNARQVHESIPSQLELTTDPEKGQYIIALLYIDY